jgi:hypothetical protein
VFSRTGIREIPEVTQLAIKAVQALGLDFGAVDVVFADGKASVLEVNSAPGLKGQTLVSYANAVRKYMGMPALTDDVTRTLIEQVTPPTVPTVAAPVAQVDRNAVTQGDVILRLDRPTAMKLKAILLGLNL